MHIKDHNDAMKFFRTYDNVASKGKWKEFVDEMEFDSMVQEPRTMAQEPRNMYAGGQLVRNTADGSRPGYNGKRKIYKVIREITEIDKIQAANKGTPIPKNAKYKVQLPSSTMQINELGQEVKKTGTKMQYAETKNILQKAIDVSDNYKTSGQLSKDISDRMQGNKSGFKIGNETGVQFGKGQKGSITPEMLKVNTDIIDEIIKTESLDVRKLADKFDMSLKDMNQKLTNFTRAYYKNRIGEGGVYLNKYDDGVLSKVLGKLNASDFKNQYERSMTELVSQAYPKGSKNLTAAIDNVKNYHKTNLLIAKKFPSLYSTLDHSVPYTYIRDITEAGGNPKNLIKVRPLPKQANTFKTLIDRRSIDLGKKLKVNPKDAKLLKDFKNLNFIKKQIPLEFGTTTSTGKVVSYANQAVSGKTDLVEGIVKGNKQFNELIDFSKNLDPKSDLSKLLTKSEKTQLANISTVKKVSEKQLQSQIEEIFKKKGMKLRKGEAGFIATDILKDIKKLGKKGLRLLSSDWVWPEIVIGWLDKQNNIQKGMSPERASSEMWKSVTFGLWDKGGTENAVLEQVKKLGYGENDVRAVENFMRYGKLSKEIEETEGGIKSMEEGYTPFSSEKGAQQLRKKLENLKKEQESVAGFYFGAIGDKEANYGYELYDQASKELMRTEWNRSLEGRKKRIDPYAGGIGDVVQSDVFSVDAWLPQNFLGATKSKSTLAREKIASTTAEERGIGYERVHPQYGAAMSDKQMEPLRDQIGYMYREGGLAGLMKKYYD